MTNDKDMAVKPPALHALSARDGMIEYAEPTVEMNAVIRVRCHELRSPLSCWRYCSIARSVSSSSSWSSFDCYQVISETDVCKNLMLKDGPEGALC